MYYEHFGLQSPPFKITPDPHFFYTGGHRGLVLDALVYAILQGEGIVKVVGEVGSGKTMLCRMLEQRLPSNVEIVYLANPSVSPDMILHAIAFELHLPVNSQSNRLEVMQILQKNLLEKYAANKQVVVFVEEAQSMPLATLEEIRLLSNLETAKHKLLQMVLFGQPELDENLAAVHIRQLKERITHSFYLSALNREEIKEYLHFRMYAVGYRGPAVFTAAAVKALTYFSAGLMRRINILADKALLAAFAENQHYVTKQHVRRAARDSGLLVSYNVLQSRWLFAAVLGLGGGLGIAFSHYQADLTQFLGQFFPTLTTSAAPLPPTNKPISAPVATLAPAKTESIETPVKTESVEIANAWQAWLEHSQQKLKQSNPQAYSVQVMESASDKQAELLKFLQKPELQTLTAQLFIVQTPNTWRVMFGEFSDENAANQAIAQLPDFLQKHKPYLRKIGSL